MTGDSNIDNFLKLNFKEYELMEEGYKLRNLDETLKMHQNAWLNNQVRATKKGGEPIFSSFKKFFDFKSVFRQTMGISKREEDEDLAIKRRIANSNKAT